jgi:hypothetical protein
MPLVAMTREMGSSARTWPRDRRAHQPQVVYQEIIEPLANKMRLRKSHVERFLEGKSGIWDASPPTRPACRSTPPTRPSGSCATGPPP